MAGALLAVSVALRIFPGFVLAALGLQALFAMIAARRFTLTSEQRRLFAGAVLAGLLLFAFSLSVGGGRSAWSEYFTHQRAHQAAQKANVLSLSRIVSDATRASPVETHASAASDAGAVKQPNPTPGLPRWIFATLLAGYLLLFSRVAAREPAWVIAVLGFGWPMLAGNLPGYDSAGLLAFALLSTLRPSIGVALCLLSLAGWWIVGAGQPWDPNFTGVSLASVVFIVAANALLLQTTPRRGPVAQSAG